MKKVIIALMSLGVLYASAQQLPIILKQDSLDLDHIEPLTFSTYKELIAQRAAKGLDCILARVVTRGRNGLITHFVEAGEFNKRLFKNLYPAVTPNPPLVYINPLNDKPIIEPIYYLVFTHAGSQPLATHLELMQPGEQGELVRRLFDAHYHPDADERARAFLQLGRSYDDGMPEHKDVARRWYEHAVQQNSVGAIQAQAALALARLTTGVDAQKWYERAAQQKEDRCVQGQACLALGELHRLKPGKNNMAQARSYYERVLAQPAFPEGHPFARVGLAEMYRTGGNGVEKNFTQAADLYKAALKAAPQSLNDIIEHGLGQIYSMGGFGVARDFAQAANHYNKISTSRNNHVQAIAQANLGEIYRIGGFGVQRDARTALGWYQKAATQEHHLPSKNHAKVGMAALYQEGDGSVAANLGKAYELYMSVAQCTGDTCVQAAACNGLGGLCAAGKGVEKNDVQALAWYEQAMNQNRDKQAQAIAYKKSADIYRSNAGPVHDLEQAIALYTKAAQQTDDMAAYVGAHEALGALYLRGEGTIAQDLDAALRWYEPLAQQTFDKQAQERARAALKKMHKQSSTLVSKIGKALTVSGSVRAEPVEASSTLRRHAS